MPLPCRPQPYALQRSWHIRYSLSSVQVSTSYRQEIDLLGQPHPLSRIRRHSPMPTQSHEALNSYVCPVCRTSIKGMPGNTIPCPRCRTVFVVTQNHPLSLHTRRSFSYNTLIKCLLPLFPFFLNLLTKSFMDWSSLPAVSLLSLLLPWLMWPREATSAQDVTLIGLYRMLVRRKLHLLDVGSRLGLGIMLVTHLVAVSILIAHLFGSI